MINGHLLQPGWFAMAGLTLVLVGVLIFRYVPRAWRGITTKRFVECAIVAAVIIAMLVATAALISNTTDPAILVFWALTNAVAVWGLVSYLAGRNRFANNPLPDGKILAIIPTYNEQPGALMAAVNALLNQTIMCDVIVIDDGSDVPVDDFDHPRVTLIRQPNQGKRAAQVTALRATKRDEYAFHLTVDSDSAPHHDALEHLLRAMHDPTVWAATGWIYTRNYAHNWVTRAADLDIGAQCVTMRSSYTRLGAVDTTSGALALYREALLWDHADEYLTDTMAAGDDHWLTTRALLRGKAIGVNEAIVVTDMPTTVSKTFKQRVRWCRSNHVMLGFILTRYRPRHLISTYLALIALLVYPVVSGAILLTFAAIVFGPGHQPWPWLSFAAFGGLYVIERYAVTGLYLLDRNDMPTRQKLVSWLFGTPALTLFSVFAVTLPKYYALLKLRDSGWSTRGHCRPRATVWRAHRTRLTLAASVIGLGVALAVMAQIQPNTVAGAVVALGPPETTVSASPTVSIRPTLVSSTKPLVSHKPPARKAVRPTPKTLMRALPSRSPAPTVSPTPSISPVRKGKKKHKKKPKPHKSVSPSPSRSPKVSPSPSVSATG